MRHGKKINHLGRTSSHRAAMLSNMASSLIMHKRIVTTVAKAKALRVFLEPIITRSKEATTHNYRTAFAYLKDKVAVTELFTIVGEKVASRPGGYTRILKTGNRAGDNAEMAMIELVDFNELFVGFNVDKKKATTRRSRRGGAISKSTSTNPELVTDAIVIDAATEEIATEEIATEEIAAEEIAAEEIATEEIAAEEIAAEEIAAEEIAAEEIATEEIAAEEIATEEIAAEEIATEEIAAEEIATEEIVDEGESPASSLAEENPESAENDVK